jgi:hypothetical protein
LAEASAGGYQAFRQRARVEVLDRDQQQERRAGGFNDAGSDRAPAFVAVGNGGAIRCEGGLQRASALGRSERSTMR